MKNNSYRSVVFGFTLLEILAVMGVIGILIALLFPVLGKMKEPMNASRCISNLKTIGGAVLQYAAENQGEFPVSRLQYTTDANGNKKTVPFLPDLLNQKEYLPLKNLNKIWWCPGDQERPANMRKHSYGVNQRLGGDYATVNTWDGQPNPRYDSRYATLQGVEKPLSQVMYIIDYVDKGDSGKWSSVVTGTRWPMAEGSEKENVPNARVDFTRHSQQANALFLDGSVRSFTFEDLVGTGNHYITP